MNPMLDHAASRYPLVEPEITRPVHLCTADGHLNPAAVGWSRRPLHRCNLTGHPGRKKRWDYWCVTTDHHLFAVTCADLDYLGLVNVYFLDYASRRVVDKTAIRPLAIGFDQPETVGGADIRFRGIGVDLAIVEEPSGTRLVAEIGGSLSGSLSADILVDLPEGHESLGVVVPFAQGLFQYTSKHNTRPARGRVIADGVTYRFDKSNQAFGCLDFGRGVWPYACTWNWASASGAQGGRTIGLQLGGQWTDGTGMTENALCVDGRIHKIHEDLVFTYDRSRFMAPWRIRAPHSHRVDLAFVPFFERKNKIELGVARSEAHQMFGRFEGSVVTDDGARIPIAGLIGWAEEHRARW